MLQYLAGDWPRGTDIWWDFGWALVDVDTTLKPIRFLCGNPASGNRAYDESFF